MQQRISRISLGVLLLYFAFLSVWFGFSLIMNPMESVQKDIDTSFSQLTHNQEILYQTESKTEDFCIYYYPFEYVDISSTYSKDISDTATDSTIWKMQCTYMKHLPTYLSKKFYNSWMQLEQNRRQTDVVQIMPLEDDSGFYAISEAKAVLVLKEKTSLLYIQLWTPEHDENIGEADMLVLIQQAMIFLKNQKAQCG